MKERATVLVHRIDTGHRRVSAADQAYAKLREMIITGALQPSEVVNEQDLVERLGIGRTPIREAIQRLRWQHVMTVFPRRGLAIAKLGLEDVQAIFEAREAVEQKTAELAAIRRTDSQARRLSEIWERLRDLPEPVDVRKSLPLDQDLHRAIANAARNPLLAENLDELLMLSDWIWHRFFAMRGAYVDNCAHHDELVQAILEQDADAAGKHMVAHLRHSHELVLSSV